MAKSPEEMKAAMIAGLQAKTGKSLEEWLAVLRSSELTKHKEFMTVLKADHGLSHGFANLIALQRLHSDSHTISDTDTLVDAQFAGTKSGLRPIYDSIISTVKKFGPDVRISPKKAYVSLRGNKQFAIVQPSTSSRVDVGLVLKGVEPDERLEASGSFNAMVSHRVRVTKLSDLDKQLIAWLKRAYDAA